MIIQEELYGNSIMQKLIQIQKQDSENTKLKKNAHRNS